MKALLCFVLSLAASAQTAERLPLSEARERALRGQPRIESARLLALAAAQNPHQVRSTLLPQLSANLTGVGASDDVANIISASAYPSNSSSL